MSFKNEKLGDVLEILAEYGEPVTWKGKTYAALVSDPAIGEDLNFGGFNGTGEFSVKILRSAFGEARPKHGEVIGFEGNSYRIVRITDHPRYPLVVLVVSPEE